MSGQRNIVINNKDGLPTYYSDASEPVINRISRRDLGGLLRETVITDAAIARSRASLLPAVTDYLTRTPVIDLPDPTQERLDKEHRRAMERGQLELEERRVRIDEDAMRLRERESEKRRLGRTENSRSDGGVVMADLFGREGLSGQEGSGYPERIPRNQGQGEQGNSSSGQLSHADGKQYERYFRY